MNTLVKTICTTTGHLYSSITIGRICITFHAIVGIPLVLRIFDDLCSKVKKNEFTNLTEEMGNLMHAFR
ncbi:hypothetical protein X798_07650, partial [Onchocerca flexuosa]